MSQGLPSIREDLVAGTKPSATFYRWFGRIEAALNAGTLSDDEAAAGIRAIAIALGSPDGNVDNIPPLNFLPRTTYVHEGAGIDVSGSLAGGGVDVSVADDGVTNAKLANMAANKIKARKTGSTGDPEDCTLSEVLDFVGSAANGDILIRASGAWTRLARRHERACPDAGFWPAVVGCGRCRWRRHDLAWHRHGRRFGGHHAHPVRAGLERVQGVPGAGSTG